MRNDQINQKLQALFVAYKKNLPGKMERIEGLWVDLLQQWDERGFKDFHREIHSLCGSAGTYGYTALGGSARQLEIYLKPLLMQSLLSDEEKHNITSLLSQLKNTLAQQVPDYDSLNFHNAIVETTKNTVYVLEKDAGFNHKMEETIKQLGYNLCKLNNISMLEHVMNENAGLVLLVDIQCISEMDIHALQSIQGKLINTIPIICMSDNADILTRLKAVHMGGQAFLTKPVDPFQLARALNQLCGTPTFDPYRILIIDDSRSIAEYFSLILQEAGMITSFITNPLSLIESIEEFQPDLLLMDVYMPECTGLELAAVLRQESLYTKIPIIFLSTEDDRLKQLSALNLGGDDFLTKPIEPQHLVEAVKSRAKRAGILSSFMMRDSLTGLLNHTNILKRLDIELARAQRQSMPLTFVMLDIDHFKNVNDTYGHLNGDKVIRSLANLLSTSLRKTDIVGRYGGEEFAIILPNTHNETALTICDNLRYKFSQFVFTSNSSSFSSTISLGVVNYPYLQDSITLVAAADQALYKAKHNGRNQTASFELPFNDQVDHDRERTEKVT